VTFAHHYSKPWTPLPFDQVGTAIDANGFWDDPMWGQQVTSGTLPDALISCNGFPFNDGHITFGSPPCTRQLPSIDYPASFNDFICQFGGNTGKVHGHVNWGFATFEGPIRWDSHSAAPPFGDDDVNMNLTPPNEASLTVENADFGPGLHTEMRYTETLTRMHTPWWVGFRDAVNNGDPSTLIDNHPTIETGLVGTDCEHGCYTEIHPIMGLSIQATSSVAGEDEWALFSRNFGNEGYCSQDEHYMDLMNDTYVVTLPWKTGATSGSVDWTHSIFETNDQTVVTPTVTFVPNVGVKVAIQLADPSARVSVDGQLFIVWS
jgi:hypothetical protein